MPCLLYTSAPYVAGRVKGLWWKWKRDPLTVDAVLIGLALQILVLPWVAFGLALGFGLPAELAVGLMLLAASPGGATANIYSHLARGDVALNLSLIHI